ncbi:hypothetical protein [Bradyrhizobium sp. 76]|uniref:hypothetical protein n=1 Tax=Bradyrhizobium sp. 76 TaxID=2782680 RepID=UPI001FFBCA06|nr:hypothetical protein [Bradyrhizobium sp. 76]MCK1407639.1 hypothetical protein [Bradyrhizobium sp. 76]
MKACDTCVHLKVPANAEHAKNYRVCTVVTPLPANMHVWFRAEMEGRVEGSARWITIKAVEERIGLKDCELHQRNALNDD